MRGSRFRPRALRHALAVLVVGGAIVLLAFRLRRHAGSLADLELNFRWGWVAASVGVLGVWFGLRALLWTRIVRRLGERIDFRPAASMWFASELGRYVPVGGWHFVARALLAERAGVRPSASVAASLIELGMVGLAAAVLALVAVPDPEHRGLWALRAGGLVLTLLAVLVQGPLLSALVSRVLRRTGREPLAVPLRLTDGLALFPLAMGAWIAQGAAFVLLTAGLGLGGIAHSLPLAGAYAAAWLVGLVVVVAPGGLGVRENALASLLPPVLGAAPPALVLALVSRLWVTVAEVLYAALAIARGATGHTRRPPA